jgi:DNA helicase-4
LLLKSWQQQCQEKKAQAKGWRLWLEEEMGWQLPEGDWQDKKCSGGWPAGLTAGSA